MMYNNLSNNEQRQLLDTINQVSFAAYDMLLYLDTHPEDQKAMEFYHKHMCMRKEAMRKYAQLYGPLTMDCMDESCSDCWKWAQQPWPWELPEKGRC